MSELLTVFNAINALIDHANTDEDLMEWFVVCLPLLFNNIELQAEYVVEWLEPHCNTCGNQIHNSS